MMKSKLSIVAFLCCIGMTGGASAATITFGDGDALTGANANGYTEAGMVLSGSPNGIQDWQIATTGSNGTGEREMLFRQTITFQLVSGGLFDLLSLDIEDPFGTGAHWSTIGSALLTGSNGATQSFLATDFGTKIATGFTNISSFTIGCLATGCQVTVDNIEFREVSGAVPVPAGLPLLLGGLGMLAFGRRRSTSA